MVKVDKATWKAKYFQKLMTLCETYNRVLVCGIENVRSSQMQSIRIGLRGKAELLMGKNTMIRKCLRLLAEDHPALQVLNEHIVLNVGLCFTNEDPSLVRDMLLANRVEAPAKAGTVAPKSVTVPAGSTGMGPEKTSFFQALNIPTKIARGSIEIINDVNLITKGDKVGQSEAVLLQMLGVRPFEYGLTVEAIYEEGSVYGPEVLDIKPEDVAARFLEGVSRVAAVSLAIGYPTKASVPHSVANAMKNVLAVCIATNIDIPQAEKIKAILSDPEAFAAAAAAAAAAAPAAGGAAPAAAKAKAPEPEPEEEDEDMGFDLFD